MLGMDEEPNLNLNVKSLHLHESLNFEKLNAAHDDRPTLNSSGVHCNPLRQSIRLCMPICRYTYLREREMIAVQVAPPYSILFFKGIFRAWLHGMIMYEFSKGRARRGSAPI